MVENVISCGVITGRSKIFGENFYHLTPNKGSSIADIIAASRESVYPFIVNLRAGETQDYRKVVIGPDSTKASITADYLAAPKRDQAGNINRDDHAVDRYLTRLQNRPEEMHAGLIEERRTPYGPIVYLYKPPADASVEEIAKYAGTLRHPLLAEFESGNNRFFAVVDGLSTAEEVAFLGTKIPDSRESREISMEEAAFFYYREEIRVMGPDGKAQPSFSTTRSEEQVRIPVNHVN